MNISRSAFSEHLTMRIDQNCSFQLRGQQRLEFKIGPYPYYKVSFQPKHHQGTGVWYQRFGRWNIITKNHPWRLM